MCLKTTVRLVRGAACGSAFALRVPRAGPVFGYGALLLFFVYSSLEVNSLLHWRMPAFQEGGMSILWALFAISFIAAGPVGDTRWPR